MKLRDVDFRGGDVPEHARFTQTVEALASLFYDAMHEQQHQTPISQTMAHIKYEDLTDAKQREYCRRFALTAIMVVRAG
jgi:hypothetical protein